MASECQRPMSFMVLASTLPHSRAMAPPARRERALIAFAGRPVEWKHAVAADRNWVVISVAFMRMRRPR